MLTGERREAANGVYDIHTNVMHYARNTQPTHARWERIPEGEESVTPTMNGEHSSNHMNGDISAKSQVKDEETIFAKVPPSISRNFMVNDIVYVSPAMPDMPYPGPDGEVMDEFDTSLSSVPQDLIDLLDDQQRRDFLQARELESEWKTQWKSEAEDKLRGELYISYNS